MALKEIAPGVDSVPKATERAHPRLQALVDAARACGPLRVAIAYPCDVTSLSAAIEAARVGLVTPILVGPRARIEIGRAHV